MEQKTPIASPKVHRAAMRHLMLTDHGFLRLFWTHEYEIAPGVWRSNQPAPDRIAKWATRGVRTIILLRGKLRGSPIHDLERAACHAHGLTLIHAPVGGGELSSRALLLRLLDAFSTATKPFVMHCKSGIDRTGFAAFLYLLAETDTPPEIAREQLSFKYLHLKFSRHGILDHMADSYLAAHRRSGIALRDWIETEYDAEAMTAAFRAGQPAA